MSVDYSGIKGVRKALPFSTAGLNDHLVHTSVVLSRALGRGGCGSEGGREGISKTTLSLELPLRM